MTKIICLGSSAKDIIFPISEGEVKETPEDLEAQKKIVFELGAKYQVLEERHESIGGCAANVASGLARLGVETYCATRLGDDDAGKWLKKELETNGVKTDLVQVGKNHKSDLSAIVAHIPSEDRIIFSDRDSNEKLEIIPEEIKKIGAQWIFLSSLNGNVDESWDKKLDKILNLISEENIKLIFNPGQKNIKNNQEKVIEAIRQSEMLIINKDEAIEIVDKLDDSNNEMINDEKFLAEKLNRLGAKIIALTDGQRGAWGFDGKEFLHVEAKKEKVADTLGAGDAFSSGFISAHLKGKNLGECLKWGIENSASAIKNFGAVKGLLKEEEIS
ncbi:MAG TPA: carbohydrate kinase family protein [Candidatus Moranbacteria bacterium]|nr:carbohydrate kinase family protein [Candidatus Moranbacteria bacterium]